MNRQSIYSVFVLLGVIALSMQWLWAILPFMPLLIESSFVVDFAPAPTTSRDIHLPEQLSLLSLIVTGLAVTLSLAAGAYALYKIPTSVSKKAEVSSRKISMQTTNHLSKKKHLTKKQRVTLSRRLQLIIGLSLSLMAFIALLPTYLIDSPLSMTIILTVGLFLLPWPALWFCAAYFIQPKSPTKKRHTR